MNIKGRSQHGIDAFVEYVKEHFPQFKNIIVCDTVEEMVRDTEVMSFASTSSCDVSTFPYVKGEWVKPGAMIVAPSAEEYPYPTFGNINIIGSKFTDMIHEGKISKDDVTDMGEILLGKAPGRQSDDDIIIYSVGGMPVEDVAWGSICYRKALEMGIGVKLHLWDVPTLA